MTCWDAQPPPCLLLLNSGFKISMTTRTFDLTCSHRRQILSTTTVHPGRWNEKTLVKLDDFVNGVRGRRRAPDSGWHQVTQGHCLSVVSTGHCVKWFASHGVVDTGMMKLHSMQSASPRLTFISCGAHFHCSCVDSITIYKTHIMSPEVRGLSSSCKLENFFQLVNCVTVNSAKE